MKITFEDKEQLITNPNIPRKNKVVADDVNEIKRAINDNDDSIEELDTRKADKSEIPTNLNQLSNADTKFVNETQMANAVQQETTARQQQDIELQNQIDAITSQSDVVDIVGTYAELMDYDTSTITENDIVKVLNDNTHDNATSYFRWNNNTWNYVGSEGPHYTKGETDERLNQKANQTSLDQTNENLNTLAGRVGTNETDISGIKAEQATQNRQIATLISDSGNKIELSVNTTNYVLTATLKNKAGTVLNTSNVDLPLEAMIVNATYDSTTKELVLTLQNGTTLRVSLADIVSGLVSQDDFDNLEVRVENLEGDVADIKDEQDTQNAEIEELQEQVENLENTVNSELEDGTATGEEISVTDSANAPAKLLPSGNTYQAANIKTYECEGTETGDYYFTYNNINYQFTMPTIEAGSILAFNTDTLKLYLGDTEITTTTDNTGTLITLQDTPNPEYEQPNHKVEGHNEFLVQNKNLAPKNWAINFVNAVNNSQAARLETINNRNCLYFIPTAGYPNYKEKNFTLGLKFKENTQYTVSYDVMKKGSNLHTVGIRYTDGSWSYTSDSSSIDNWEHKSIVSLPNKTIDYIAVYYTGGTTYIDIDTWQIEEGTSESTYVPHEEQALELDLPEGMEMCKIGDYADTFEKVDGKWYKGEMVHKYISDGSENITTYKSWELAIFGIQTNFEYNLAICNKYVWRSDARGGNYSITPSWNRKIQIRDDRFVEDNVGNVTAFKNDLANNNLLMYYVEKNPVSTYIEITDQTLISQLDKMQKVLSYYGGTNITTISAEDLNPILNFDYKKSNRLRIEALEERLNSIQGG